jgi:hypothetical protein
VKKNIKKAIPGRPTGYDIFGKPLYGTNFIKDAPGSVAVIKGLHPLRLKGGGK